MGFKSLNDFNATKYAGKFVLDNDGDQAKAIFLYRNESEVLVGDVHYIRSADYSGYVHCLGRGCPACAKGIRRQTKVFIPMYLMDKDEIVFWDRPQKFIPQFQFDVLKACPDPCNYVFTVTRHGVHGSIDTRYSLEATNRSNLSYDEIMSKYNYTFPDFYENICKEVDYTTMNRWLTSGSNGSYGVNGSSLPVYNATPRVSTSPSAVQQSLDSIPSMPVSEAIDADEDDGSEINGVVPF